MLSGCSWNTWLIQKTAETVEKKIMGFVQYVFAFLQDTEKGWLKELPGLSRKAAKDIVSLRVPETEWHGCRHKTNWCSQQQLCTSALPCHSTTLPCVCGGRSLLKRCKVEKQHRSCQEHGSSQEHGSGCQTGIWKWYIKTTMDPIFVQEVELKCFLWFYEQRFTNFTLFQLLFDGKFNALQ